MFHADSGPSIPGWPARRRVTMTAMSGHHKPRGSPASFAGAKLAQPPGENAGPTVRYFDLNIEKVLEHWSAADALRELIANALDEQALTDTREPEITEEAGGRWHIRDWGRGLRYEHFTQKEDPEK